jgi:activator of 2-hydroxyglutaryl-CoA dehydratase
MCTVFAESEVVGLVAAEEIVPDIVAAVHRSIARRVRNMAMRIPVREKVMMTGGVAKNIGVVKALEEFLGFPLLIPEEPQLVGALGAAVIALEHSQNLAKAQT